MNRRSELINLTSSDTTPSFSLWNDVLCYFIEHKDELSIEELEIIVDKCEQCRLYLNERSLDPIEKVDTNPNVYEYLAKRKNKNNNKEEYSETHYAVPA